VIRLSFLSNVSPIRRRDAQESLDYSWIELCPRPTGNLFRRGFERLSLPKKTCCRKHSEQQLSAHLEVSILLSSRMGIQCRPIAHGAQPLAPQQVPRPREDPNEIDQTPPPAIDQQKVDDIPELGSLEEGIDLFEALGRNIELQVGVGELTYRAQKLEHLKKANEAKRCLHTKARGIQCGSPAVGGKSYCCFFFHQMIHDERQQLPT